MIEEIFLFAASFVANMMSALAGGGAGLLQLPALLWLDLDFPVALATHKIATVFLGLGATARLYKDTHLLDKMLAFWIASAGMIGTVLGAYVIIHVPGHIATLALGVLIIALGIYSALKRDMGIDYALKNQSLKGRIIGCAIIFTIGLMNGSITAGSGLFVTLCLILWWGMDYKRAVAYTMILVGIFWNASGAVALIALGEPVKLDWLLILIVGSFLGGYAGSHLGLVKGNTVIKYVFVSVTLLSGASLLFKVL